MMSMTEVAPRDNWLGITLETTGGLTTGSQPCINDSFKSFAGFTGYTGAVNINYLQMATFTAIVVGGSFVGTLVSQRISGDMLKRGFAVFLSFVATYILIKSVL